MMALCELDFSECWLSGNKPHIRTRWDLGKNSAPWRLTGLVVRIRPYKLGPHALQVWRDKNSAEA